MCGSEDDKKKGVPGKTQTTEDIYSLPVSNDMKPSASQIKMFVSFPPHPKARKQAGHLLSHHRCYHCMCSFDELCQGADLEKNRTGAGSVGDEPRSRKATPRMDT